MDHVNGTSEVWRVGRQNGAVLNEESPRPPSLLAGPISSAAPSMPTSPAKLATGTHGITERQRILKRQAALLLERTSWITHWQDLNDYFLPRRLRYLQTERNRGTKRNDKIINGVGTKSARTLGAGKMTGFTSPARPWFRYVVSDPALRDDDEVKTWLASVEKVVAQTVARSNVYAKLHETWLLQGVFATAAFYLEEDEKDDIRGYTFPLGQFCLGATAQGRIDLITREFEYTVDQIVREFGVDACSVTVRQAYENGELDRWIKILHVIEPNVNRATGKIDNHNMPYVSTWWEKSAPEGDDRPLRKSGFVEFPVMVARWDVIGEDIYGSGSPGMDSLGDNKALQLMERRKAEAVDKVVRPPMKAPTSAKTQRLSALPGDTSYLDESAQGAKFEPAIVTDPRAITAARDTIQDHATRIQEAFHVDLFRMMQMDDRQQPVTAREINERHEEKMLQLGPVIERDEDEVLDPLHTRIIGILFRKGKIPPVPPKLRGQHVKIEYISMMAQAQKLLGTASTERFVSFIGSLSAVNKDVLDLPNWDLIVKKYAEDLGLSPDKINPEEVIQAIRQQRAQAQQAQAQQQASLAAVQGAKVASETDLGGDTALSRLMNTVGGAGGSLAPGR